MKTRFGKKAEFQAWHLHRQTSNRIRKREAWKGCKDGYIYDFLFL